MAKLRKILVLSDTHCGSVFGLCPPVYQAPDGAHYDANKIQKWMWNKWLHFTNKWLPSMMNDEPFVLVLNGDLIDGAHHGATEVIHPDPFTHTRLAYHILLDLVDRADKTFLVRGTECHTTGSETLLGEMLGASPCPATNDPCWEQLSLQINGTLCSFKHHIGTSMRQWTEGSGLSTALSLELAIANHLGHEAPSVIIRSHRHKYGMFENGAQLIAVTPPWQMMTRYAKRVTQHSITETGAIVLHFEGAKSELPRLSRTIYTPAPDPIVSP